MRSGTSARMASRISKSVTTPSSLPPPRSPSPARPRRVLRQGRPLAWQITTRGGVGRSATRRGHGGPVGGRRVRGWRALWAARRRLVRIMSTLFDDLSFPGFDREQGAAATGASTSPGGAGPVTGVTPKGVPTWAEAAARGGVVGPAGRHTDLGPEALLEGLNTQQREAVVHEGTPLLIVAGA